MKDLMNFNNEPFMLLEGGTGLNDQEEEIYKKLVEGNREVWSIEDLYQKPERLASIQFLKPKTLIFGTTGVYKKELGILVDLAREINLSSIESVVLTLDTRHDFGRPLREFKEKYPNIKFYELVPFNEYEVREIWKD